MFLLRAFDAIDGEGKSTNLVFHSNAMANVILWRQIQRLGWVTTEKRKDWDNVDE